MIRCRKRKGRTMTKSRDKAKQLLAHYILRVCWPENSRPYEHDNYQEVCSIVDYIIDAAKEELKGEDHERH